MGVKTCSRVSDRLWVISYPCSLGFRPAEEMGKKSKVMHLKICAAIHEQERERLKDEERRYGAQILSEQIEERKIQRLLQEEQVEQVTSPLQTQHIQSF